MSATWKGYTLLAPGGPYTAFPQPCKSHVDPVIVTPIEDESLPHPGDGKEWELAGKRAEIKAVANERAWVLKGGVYMTVWLTELRERKPEHNARCQRYRDHYGRKDCICEERRSGEDRRQGERRRGFDGGSVKVASGIRWGRRDGTDRRQP